MRGGWETDAVSAAVVTRVWRPGWELDLAAILGPLVRGSGDPTVHTEPTGAVWRAGRTPDGPATTRIHARADLGEVHATAWGPGAEWALETLPDLLGAGDDPSGFTPLHPLVRDAWRRHRGWRVPRTRRVLEAMLPAVLEQKVTGREAWRAFRTLVRRHGERAPGPAGLVPRGLWVQPEPEAWRAVPSWEWHRAGVDLARSRTAVTAAGVAGRLEQLPGLAPAEAVARLRSLPGVGAWTAAEVAQRALGDADSVSVGDFHLAKLVGWALVGERVDDDTMLELLEPYAGHRYRAVRMIELSGLGYPRRGPRRAPRDYRAI